MFTCNLFSLFLNFQSLTVRRAAGTRNVALGRVKPRHAAVMKALWEMVFPATTAQPVPLVSAASPATNGPRQKAAWTSMSATPLRRSAAPIWSVRIRPGLLTATNPSKTTSRNVAPTQTPYCSPAGLWCALQVRIASTLRASLSAGTHALSTLAWVIPGVPPTTPIKSLWGVIEVSTGKDGTVCSWGGSVCGCQKYVFQREDVGPTPHSGSQTATQHHQMELSWAKSVGTGYQAVVNLNLTPSTSRPVLEISLSTSLSTHLSVL